MNAIKEKDNSKLQTEQEDNQPIPPKTPWWKSMFKAIGSFFSKIFNTIAYLIYRPSINEPVKINNEFPTYSHPSAKTEETEIRQQESVIEQEMKKEDNIEVDFSDNSIDDGDIIELADSVDEPVSEDVTNHGTIEDDKIDEILSPTDDDSTTIEDEDTVILEKFSVKTEDNEEVSNFEKVEAIEETEATENVKDTKTVTTDIFTPTKFDSFNELCDNVAVSYDGLAIETIVPIMPEDNAYDVVILTNKDKTFTCSISDTYEDAMGLDAVSQRITEELSIPSDLTKNIVKQLQENIEVIKEYTNEKRINMITAEVTSANMETKEDLIQMALNFLNTPNRTKAQIEETRDEAFFVFPQSGSDFDDPDKTVISDEIKINLSNFEILESIEVYDFMSGRNEHEEKILSREDLPKTIQAILNVLENNKDFINKEFFQTTSPTKSRSANRDTYIEADDVLNDYKKNKHDKHQGIRDARRKQAEAREFEEDLATGEAFKTKAQKKAENRTRFNPNHDDIDY